MTTTPFNASRLKRPANVLLDDMLGVPHPVLDHGFIRLVDYMGGDPAIVQAARVSYGEGTKTFSDDRGLIRYLMRQWHTTPFEMCEIKIHVKLPIFVARQWIRHRTANVNEYSARYSILSDEFYLPKPEHLAPQSTSNRQGREGVYEAEESEDIRSLMEDSHRTSYNNYEDLVGKSGFNLARESARGVLPLSTYTEWYWKVDLHNLLHFLRLRTDSHAQYEIRAYADILAEIVQQWVPITWEAFEDYRLKSVQLSRLEAQALSGILKGQQRYDQDAWNQLSAREQNELRQKVEYMKGLAQT